MSSGSAGCLGHWVVVNILRLLEDQEGSVISKAALVERGWRDAVRLIPRPLHLRSAQDVIRKSRMMMEGGIFMLHVSIATISLVRFTSGKNEIFFEIDETSAIDRKHMLPVDSRSFSKTFFYLIFFSGTRREAHE